MQDDISLVMKKRAELGYGEPNIVSFFTVNLFVFVSET